MYPMSYFFLQGQSPFILLFYPEQEISDKTQRMRTRDSTML